ncbi:hypothetical protein L1857_18205 [Amycolatopsis thermalba]|uniref:Uncharacterized protein n=1 Tax=Amycolatopsis thermalba TaxID=944492 RepID=A0ABY4NX04_9PSEU|nr:hypothetical protein L1857_18205 [Amycolatopsis thermalba]
MALAPVGIGATRRLVQQRPHPRRERRWRHLLLTGLALFAAGALLSAAAPDIPRLLAGRAITGVGVAAVLPDTLAVLLASVALLLGIRAPAARPAVVPGRGSAKHVPGQDGAWHVGRLVGRIGLTAVIALAFACTGAGLLGLSTSDMATPCPLYAVWLVVTGTGVTLALPTLSSVIAGSLPPRRPVSRPACTGATREFGSALGVAVLVLGALVILPGRGTRSPRP